MPELSEKDYAEFVRLLSELEPEIDGLRETPRNFMRDMVDKQKLYGERMFVSPKQFNWVKQLHEEFVGDTAHEQEEVEANNSGDPRDADGW